MSDHPHRALLPAGFHDLLPPDAAHEASVVERLIGIFASRGYQRVKPPLVEFEETLLGGAGATLSKDMFRVMDPISQRMMALRADMTLQIARIADARLTRDARPLRLSYAGQVLRVRGSDLRPERQFGQVGVELIGPDLADADAEVACVAIEALSAAGIENLSIDLNLPPLVPAVMRAMQSTADDVVTLRHALDRKDAATIAKVGGAAASLLGPLLACGGPAAEALDAARALPLPDEARALVRRLGDVVDRVSSALPGLMVTADLVEHRGFEYQRGVSFTIFARGIRGELGRGGRYRIGDGNEANGSEAAAGETATGVTLFTDTVLRAAPPPAPTRRIFLCHGTAGEHGARLREAGWVTVAGLSPVDRAADEARRVGVRSCLSGWANPVYREGSGLMANVAVVGAQWGDEGKGKIVDWLSSRAQVVVRFQGGHNAGHTLVIGDKTYKLSLLPSGIVRRSKLSVIGNGVVVDPWALINEIETLRGMGVEISPENLLLAENATLILPVHGAVDRAREAAKGDRRIGTTGRGIGPAYEDKVARRAIRVCDLDDRALLEAKVDDLLLHHNALLRGLGAEQIDRQWFLDQLTAVSDKILPLRRRGLEPVGRTAPRRTAHPLRRRPGGDAGRRSRDLSLRHFVQHGGCGRGDRQRHGPGRDRFCPGHHEGLHDPGRGRTLSEANRTTKSAGCWASVATSSARSPAAAAAAAGSTP